MKRPFTGLVCYSSRSNIKVQEFLEICVLKIYRMPLVINNVITTITIKMVFLYCTEKKRTCKRLLFAGHGYTTYTITMQGHDNVNAGSLRYTTAVELYLHVHR